MEAVFPRLQKVLADAGVASRRASEEIIAQGRVSVNGRVVREQGQRVDPASDLILLDGQPLPQPESARTYIALNKPAGFVSTAQDTHGRPTVLDLVRERPERLYPVGRLDADTTGLLLLTNDGDLAYRLTHPRFHLPRTYKIRARGFVDREAASRLTEGVELEDGRTAPAEIRFLGFDSATRSTLLEMTLFEGKNRQVRRMLTAVGHPVSSLQRVAFGPVQLRDLAPGTWRKLRPTEVQALRSAVEGVAGREPNPRSRRGARRP